MNPMRTLFSLFLLCLLPVTAMAADAKTAAVSSPDTAKAMISMVLGLLAVLAVIFICAWLVKRMNGLQGANNSAMRVVSVIGVGPRERIALLDVGGTQVLVGITPQNIRRLHVFDEPVVETGRKSESDFASRLQAMLARGLGNQERGTSDDLTKFGRKDAGRGDHNPDERGDSDS